MMTADAGKIEYITYASWEMFKRDIALDLFDNGVFVRGRFLFRGQRRPGWPLISSFEREFGSRDLQQRNEIEGLLLTELQAELEGTGIVDLTTLSHESLLAFAQHYGMPTRLLDWTLSPYVAAFFAFSRVVVSAGGLADANAQVAVWAADTRSRLWQDSGEAKIVEPPRLGNLRLRNQQGRFTLLRSPHVCLDEHVRQSPFGDIPLRQVLLPAPEAHKALSDLDLMGIHHSSLFPGAEGCVKAAIMRTVLSLYHGI